MPPRLPDLLPLRPHLREMVWGGRRLEEWCGKELPAGQRIGEALEVSAQPGLESTVSSGPLAGWPLARLVAECGEGLMDRPVWDRCDGRFPLLVKLLDAQQDLSIQVHPDDRHARQRGLGWWGKTEAWFVLRSDGGRVACGLRPGTGPAELRRAVEAGAVEEVVEFHPVAAGDVVSLPAGTVHALCAGVMVYEVQQASDVTFRLYDYGRAGLDGKPRGLHLDEALEVTAFGAAAAPRPWRDLPGAAPDRALLVTHDCFALSYHRAASAAVHRADGAFLALTGIGGRGVARGESAEAALGPGGTVLVPAHRRIQVEPEDGAVEYLIATVPPTTG
jgi:mannose-6-phosphate isomerase